MPPSRQEARHSTPAARRRHASPYPSPAPRAPSRVTLPRAAPAPTRQRGTRTRASSPSAAATAFAPRSLRLRTRSSGARSRRGSESAGRARVRTAPTSGCRSGWRASAAGLATSTTRSSGPVPTRRPPLGGERRARRGPPRRRARDRRPSELVAGLGERPPRIAADSPARLDAPQAARCHSRGLGRRIGCLQPLRLPLRAGRGGGGPRRLVDALPPRRAVSGQGYRLSLLNGGASFLADRA